MNWRAYLPVNSHRSDPPFFGILQYFETILSWFCHPLLHRSISRIQQFHNLFHATPVKYYLASEVYNVEGCRAGLSCDIGISGLCNRVLSEESFDNYSQKTVLHLMGETKYRDAHFCMGRTSHNVNTLFCDKLQWARTLASYKLVRVLPPIDNFILRSDIDKITYSKHDETVPVRTCSWYGTFLSQGNRSNESINTKNLSIATRLRQWPEAEGWSYKKDFDCFFKYHKKGLEEHLVNFFDRSEYFPLLFNYGV